MRNHKFKFSDMIPNAWFYKLRDMSKSRSSRRPHPKKAHHKTSTSSPSLASSHQPHQPSYCTSPVNLKAYDTHFPDHPPRKSPTLTRARRRTIYRPSPKAVLSPSTNSASAAGCRSRNAKVWRTNNSILLQCPDDYTSAFGTSSESESESLLSGYKDDMNENSGTSGSLANSYNGMVSYSSTCDIVIDMKEKAAGTSGSSTKLAQKPRSIKLRPKSTRGIKLRTSLSSSPRVVSKSKRNNIHQRISGKSVTSTGSSVEESFVVVKSSFDPQRDFKESMVEMIAENNIRSSKDLEELLACYLSLNSKQFHGQIVKAFEQIWLDRIINQHNRKSMFRNDP